MRLHPAYKISSCQFRQQQSKFFFRQNRGEVFHRSQIADSSNYRVIMCAIESPHKCLPHDRAYSLRKGPSFDPVRNWYSSSQGFSIDTCIVLWQPDCEENEIVVVRVWIKSWIHSAGSFNFFVNNVVICGDGGVEDRELVIFFFWVSKKFNCSLRYKNNNSVWLVLWYRSMSTIRHAERCYFCKKEQAQRYVKYSLNAVGD